MDIQETLMEAEHDALEVMPVNINVIDNGHRMSLSESLESGEEYSHALPSRDLLLVSLECLVTNTRTHNIGDAERLEMSRCEFRMCKSRDKFRAPASNKFRNDAIRVQNTDDFLGILGDDTRCECPISISVDRKRGDLALQSHKLPSTFSERTTAWIATTPSKCKGEKSEGQDCLNGSHDVIL